LFGLLQIVCSQLHNLEDRISIWCSPQCLAAIRDGTCPPQLLMLSSLDRCSVFFISLSFMDSKSCTSKTVWKRMKVIYMIYDVIIEKERKKLISIKRRIVYIIIIFSRKVSFYFSKNEISFIFWICKSFSIFTYNWLGKQYYVNIWNNLKDKLFLRSLFL